MGSWFGNGSGIDISGKPGTELKTSTSQYLVVGIQGATTSADRTFYLANAGGTLEDTTTARNAIGINQSNMLSTGSEACHIRIMGLAKAKCAASVTAGDWIKAYEGASTTTFRGHVDSVLSGLSITVATASISSQMTILGKALADGSTNSVIEVMLMPQMYDTQFV